jgi:hypothetical protein
LKILHILLHQSKRANADHQEKRGQSFAGKVCEILFRPSAVSSKELQSSQPIADPERKGMSSGSFVILE